MQTIAIELPKPHEGQRNVLESKARFRVLMCGRRWGKSLISKQYTITESLAGNINAYITPTYSLANLLLSGHQRLWHQLLSARLIIALSYS